MGRALDDEGLNPMTNLAGKKITGGAPTRFRYKVDDLPALIARIEAMLAQAEQAAGTYQDDPTGFHARHRAEMTKLAAMLQAEVGSRINDRWDGAKVRIAGIASSSTTGFAGALRNWLRAARAKADAAREAMQ